MALTLFKYIQNTGQNLRSELKSACHESDSKEPIIRGNESYCPKTFDEVCWDETKAGISVTKQCPGYIEGFDTEKNIIKKCLMDGTWEKYDEIAFYKSCIKPDSRFLTQTITHLSIYGVTTVIMLIAVFIFWKFRKNLMCTRVKVHINLFMSKIATNIVWIITYCTAMNNIIMYSNPVWCQVLHVLTYFLTMAEYMWVFCESLHLNLATFHVFMNTRDRMPLFYLLGWGIPACISFIYVISRIYYEISTEKCWTEKTHSFTLITTVTCLSIYSSTLLVMSVLISLYNRHRGVPDMRFPGFIKILIAAVSLIPMFAVYSLLVPVQPVTQAYLESPEAVAYTILSGLTELVMAYILCFSHHDVISSLKQLFRRNVGRTSTTMIVRYAKPESCKIQISAG